MRIPGDISKIVSIYNKNKKINKTEKMQAVSGKKDTISLSSKAKEYQVAMNAIRQCPDVRQAKIKALQEQFANGTYSVSGEEVADKLVNKFLDKKI